MSLEERAVDDGRLHCLCCLLTTVCHRLEDTGTLKQALVGGVEIPLALGSVCMRIIENEGTLKMVATADPHLSKLEFTSYSPHQVSNTLSTIEAFYFLNL